MSSFTQRIKAAILNKELWIFAPVYFVYSLINLRVKLFVTPCWFDGQLAGNHQRLLAFDYYNNEQSRLLQFYIPEALRRVFGLSIENAYLLQRWIFVFVVFVVFHFYLRKWFDKPRSFAGVTFLAAVMPLSYFNHLQESSSLLLLTFLVALFAIREGRALLFAVALTLGALNNETVLILPLAYFLFSFDGWNKRLPTLAVKTGLLAVPAYAVAAAIRYVNRDVPHVCSPWQLPNNLKRMGENLVDLSFVDWWKAAYWYIVFIYGALWIYALLGYRKKPLFLRRVVWITPFFLAANFITGKILEVRLFLPLAFIIVPMAIFWMFPAGEDQPPANR